MRAVKILGLVASILAGIVLATVFGTVRGVVHDPEHRPIQGATLVLQARDLITIKVPSQMAKVNSPSMPCLSARIR